MIQSCSLLLMGLFLLLAGGPAMAQPGGKPVQHQPLIFFVAKGGPNACGAGCSEWIAAEGTFDPGAAKRFGEFLNALPRKDLPIFFHSPGGELEPSLAVGVALRERRMTAGIGQTIAEGCRDAPKADEACRKLMRSGRELQARLRFSGATCASACAYALLGASARTIGQGARFGVHATKLVLRQKDGKAVVSAADYSAAKSFAESMTYDRLRQYVATMGVDHALIDLAKRTPHERVHWLADGEMTRFGVVLREQFETRWLPYVRQDGSYFIVKSVTRPSPANRSEYRTTNIRINCFQSSRMYVAVRRELAASEPVGDSTVRLTSGEDAILVSNQGNRASDMVDVRVATVPAAMLARAAASDSILLREEREATSREIRLSTKGLADALKAIPDRCGGKV